MRLIRVYIPYWDWEDFLNGMWSKGDESRLQEAIEFTGDHERYGKAMGEVIKAWPRTMLNSLTNTGINRRAFLGHCAVCWSIGISEDITRMAWGCLTDQQRMDADAQATTHIKIYENTHRELYKTVGESLLS